MKKTVPAAVAVSYTEGEAAPRVIARGERRHAENLLDCAREHGIPIIEDPDLSALLSFVEVGAWVPPETWQALARILAFVRQVG